MVLLRNFVVLYSHALWTLSLGLLMSGLNSNRSFAQANDNVVHILVYETDTSNSLDSPAIQLLDQISMLNNVKGMLFGQGSSFDGFGSKFAAVLPILETIDHDDLVVISDSRDVLINNPIFFNSQYTVSAAVEEFYAAFEKITHNSPPGAIVVSAEAQCCVSALTHISPGGFYNDDGTRSAYACLSGLEGCLWKGDDFAEPWESFMADLAAVRNSEMYDDKYLNAGLIAGKAGDLLRVIRAANIYEDEDDQAVWTDFMFHNPSSIVLDYQQSMFGNNRISSSVTTGESCIFFPSKDGSGRLMHRQTLSTPLFIHSPGGNFRCHDFLSQLLGVKVPESLLRKHNSRLLDNTVCQYGKAGCTKAPGDGLNSLLERTMHLARNGVENFRDRFVD